MDCHGYMARVNPPINVREFVNKLDNAKEAI